MTRRLSANGKPLGRPPGKPQASMPPQTVDPATLAVAKALQTFRARYDAAGQGRKMAAWNAPSTGPNTSMQGLQTIRNRSRDANRNDWAGESSTQKWATALIGIGIVPRFRRVKSKTRRQYLTDLWNDFVAECDAECVNNGYGQQTMAVRAMIADGEVFARRRPRFLDEGLRTPVQVQLLEAEMVPLLDADMWPGLPSGNIIRSGIELNKRGKRTAFWVYKQHTGDRQNAAIDVNDLIRVAASDMIHMFEQKRPGQLRGVSSLAPVLARLRSIGDYEDTTLERQKIANLWVGFITRTLPTMDPNDVNSGALTGLEQATGTDGAGLIPLKPGLIQELEDGQAFNFANPPEAGTTYSDYIRTSHLGTAAASGLPYELFSGDIVNISDRTLRVLINEFRRFAEQRQWQIVIPQYCQRIVNWFADAAVLAGTINLDELDDVRRVEHAPHGWAYIHPTQDVQGKALEVLNGFRSRSSVIGERGDDPDTVDEERESDQARNEGLGLPVPGAPLVNVVDKPADPAPVVTQPPAKPVTALERAQTAVFNAQAQAIAREPVAPVHNVTINVPPTTVTNNMEAPTVNVGSPAVTVESPTVNVAPPAVTVEAPTVNVAAPSVTMETTVQPAEVQVHLPTRKSDTTVTYDNKGNIMQTTRIESDVDPEPGTPA